MTRLLRHAPAILYLGRPTSTPYGAALEYADELRDERGELLSIEEHRRIAALPQPEQTEAIRRYEGLRDARLRDADPTLPEVFVGGIRNYWWGLVTAATDGDVVVIFAHKGYGGKTEPISISDWFRADTVEPTGQRKFTAPGPPRENSSRGGS